MEFSVLGRATISLLFSSFAACLLTEMVWLCTGDRSWRSRFGLEWGTKAGRLELPVQQGRTSGSQPEVLSCVFYEYSLGIRKRCSPWAASVTVPAGKMMTGFPSSSTSNAVVSSMAT